MNLHKTSERVNKNGCLSEKGNRVAGDGMKVRLGSADFLKILFRV